MVSMAGKILGNAPTLSVFDFDGTLTRHDSFIPFLRFAFGRRRFTRKMLHLVFPTLRCLRRKLTRDELKEVLINTFMKDIDEQWVKEKADAYCRKYFTKLMRPKGLLAIAAELNAGATVTLCSASPEIVLRPFADQLGINLISTQLEVVDGKLTGKISGNNCRCGQKVARLEQVYGPLENYHLRAWGDTRGDYELLSAAQDPHWRYFHSSSAPKKSPLDRVKK
ncbi:HAD family hydrolase [Rosenbergiella sp. S61]|uniref:HAD family hydrolase n=2 Tax=Rosenbergiella gaditana TaxID=2726987 RepID=A0ABS5SZS3_9GAMM|nr:HAD family hydrolase [Rosenbergiella gaditana]MBT0724697.1 HAD family hydrolase [Rosenbergiella gaditana]